jgi:alanine racemase
MSLAPEKILPSTATVNLGRLASNLGVVRRLAPGKKIIAVVKANAYGHGATAIAQALIVNGVEWLAVQMPEEALELRKAGIVAPILILGYTHSAYAADILHNNLTPTIFDFDLAVELDRLSSKPVNVHIKIDTGMGWAGIAVKDAINFISSVKRLPRINIDGLFTHFASADVNPDYTKMQGESFVRILDEAKKLEVNPGLIHAANSAATVNYPQYHFDAVRTGLMLYGVPPCQCETNLLPVLSWSSLICDMKILHSGECVGYGCTYVAQSTRVIGTIPVGYADGWKWNLKDGGYVLVKGKKAPILGRICMDQFMVDLTDIADAGVGDRVTLIGDDGFESITVADLAATCNTTPYEILTSLGGRIKFQYTLCNKEAI